MRLARERARVRLEFNIKGRYLECASAEDVSDIVRRNNNGRLISRSVPLQTMR